MSWEVAMVYARWPASPPSCSSQPRVVSAFGPELLCCARAQLRVSDLSWTWEKTGQCGAGASWECCESTLLCCRWWCWPCLMLAADDWWAEDEDVLSSATLGEDSSSGLTTHPHTPLTHCYTDTGTIVCMKNFLMTGKQGQGSNCLEKSRKRKIYWEHYFGNERQSVIISLVELFLKTLLIVLKRGWSPHPQEFLHI